MRAACSNIMRMATFPIVGLLLTCSVAAAKKPGTKDYLNLAVGLAAAAAEAQRQQQTQEQYHYAQQERAENLQRNVEADYKTGCALLDSKRYSESVPYFDRVIAQMPNFHRAYNCRASAYRELGQAEAALRDVNMALSIKSDYGAAYGNRGLIKTMLGNEAGAADDLRRCFHLRPELREIYEPKARELAQQWKDQEAAKITAELQAAADQARLLEEAQRQEREQTRRRAEAEEERQRALAAAAAKATPEPVITITVPAAQERQDAIGVGSSKPEIAEKEEAGGPDKQHQIFRQYFHSFIYRHAHSPWLPWITGALLMAFVFMAGIALNEPAKAFVAGALVIVPFLMMTVSQGIDYGNYLERFATSGRAEHSKSYWWWNVLYVPAFLAMHVAFVLLCRPFLGGVLYVVMRDPVEHMISARTRQPIRSVFLSGLFTRRIRAATERIREQSKAVKTLKDEDY